VALLQTLRQWLGSARAGSPARPKPAAFRLTLEVMEDRMLLSAATVAVPVGAPVLSGEWFVQSSGLAASISEAGGQLLLTNEQGTQTVGTWQTANTFQAWGQTAQIVQDGPLTQILWNGNVWSQSTYQSSGLNGQWYVQSNGMAATILQTSNQLLLTNEEGSQTAAQWLSPTSFQAWGDTAQIVQKGPITQILWNGNAWNQSSWQNGGLSGQWFVGNTGMTASISQTGNQLILTNEQGTQTVGQWLSPTTFQAWGQTAQIVQRGALTEIQWAGNVWTQSSWQNQGLNGQWFVQSDGLTATITESNGQLQLTNEQGQQTTGQWLSPTSFAAWGQAAQITQNGAITQIQWNGNTWTQSSWQNGGLSGEWFVQSNGLPASIVQTDGQLLLINEQGTQALGQWVSPTSFQAWGTTAQVVQNGSTTQILWNGNLWSQSNFQQGGLTGQWFVQSNGLGASIIQSGGELLLTNEQGTQTLGQWLSPTTFQAWGETGQVIQNGGTTTIQWNGNAWTQSAWQVGGLGGQWIVQANGLTATIVQTANQLLLTNEQGTQTVGQWLTPTTFAAWGDTGQVIWNGNVTEIQWNGNTWLKQA